MQKIASKFLIVFAVMALTAGVGFSQSSNSRDAVRTRMIELLKYLELEKRVTPREVDLLVDTWSRAADPAITQEERTQAFRDLYLLHSKFHGHDLSENSQAFRGTAARAASVFQSGARLDLNLPAPRGPIVKDYIHVATRGHGPIEMLLIAPPGSNATDVYRSMVERYQEHYTLHLVTLPGAGLAKSIPWPEVYDVTRRPWLASIENSLLRFIAKRKGKLIVLGTSGGGYFAARLASMKPDKISAAVLVDALLYVAIPSATSPNGSLSIEERLALMKRSIPVPQFFPVGDVPASREEIKKLLDDPNSSHPAVRNWMAGTTKNEELSKRWAFESLAGGFFRTGLRFGLELQTTDLTQDLKELSVPTLAMSAIHDDKSPRAGNPGSAQWQELRRRHPEIPLSIVSVANTRSFISEDNPAEFDRLLKDFLADQQVTPDSQN